MSLKVLEVNVNILVHVIILFSILSALFWIVISKVETNAIGNEINNNIENATNQLKTTLTDDQKKIYNNFVNKSQPQIEILKNIYNQPSKVVVKNNKSLFAGNLIMIGGLIAILIAVLLTIRLGCNITGFPFLQILRENFIVFLGVGAIEALFFLKVAMKFIPTKPSQIVTNLTTDLQNNLANS